MSHTNEKVKPTPPIRTKRRESSKPEVLVHLFDENDQWFTYTEAAEFMRYAVETLRTMRSRGIGPQPIGDGASTLFRKSDCLAWRQFGKRSADHLNK